jgi:multiple sugar transport system substrate-binding protein
MFSRIEKIISILAILFIIFSSFIPFAFAEEKVKITYLTWMWPAREKLFKQTVANFQKKYPNIEVEGIFVSDSAECRQKLLTMIAGGTPPDIAHLWTTDVEKFYRSGVVLCLDPYIKRDKFPIYDLPPVKDPFFYRGKVYGLPCDGGAFVDRAIYYNVDLFKAAGLSLLKWDYKHPEATWTWQDFLQIAQKLTKDTNGDGKIDQFGFNNSIDSFPIYVWSNGGELFRKDMKKCLLDQPAAYEAIQWFANLRVKYNVMPRPEQVAGAGDLFITGRIAMENGPYMRAQAYRDAKVPFEFRLAPYPSGKNGLINLAMAHPNVILSGSKHPEEAWQFLKYTLSPENQHNQVLIWRGYPALTKSMAYSKEYLYPEYPPYDYGPLVFGKARALPKHPAWPEIWDTIMSGLDPVFLGKISAKEAVSNFVPKVNEILLKTKE